MLFFRYMQLKFNCFIEFLYKMSGQSIELF